MTRERGPGRPHAGLLETIELQRLGCELAGSPVYATVLAAVAADVGSGGVCARVLGPHRDAPFGDAVVLRFLAAVHHLVLDGLVPDLAARYPSTGGTPGDDVGDRFVAAVAAHEDAVLARMHLGVQTNEVGRSTVLLGGYLELARAGLPLRILEIGASGGLNLRFDRYRYEVEPGGASFGPGSSRLRFTAPWVGRAPDLDVDLVVHSRSGCDRDPIDPTTAEGRLRLRSYVWPDQPDRRTRLDAALAEAPALPVTVERADADDWVARHLARPTPGVHTVVVHSIVFQYLAPAARRRLLAALDEAGGRATAAAPLAWLRMEPGGDQAETRLTRWPGARTELLATSSYHGPPVAWRPTAGTVAP